MARRVSSEEGGVSAAFGTGIVGRTVERAVENPAASGGLLVMALTASAIVVNATMLQTTDQPRPNLAPLTATHVTATATPVPTLRPREQTTVPARAPAVTAAPLAPATGATLTYPPSAAAKPSASPAANADTTLVADTQRELVRLGLYGGPVDGIAGARTKAAISAFQANAGMTATGAPSAELLALLRRPPVAKPQPAPAAAKTAPTPPAPIPAAASARPAQAQPAVVVQPASLAQPDTSTAETYRRVQLALNQMGYGPLPVDGRASKETADAIRRFELEYGLPVNGIPDDAVIRKMVAVGALAAR